MTQYLLDTNILSDLVRYPGGEIRRRIGIVGQSRVYTSVVVTAELRFGISKRGSRRLATQLDAILGALKIVPFSTPADVIYGTLRAEFERLGTPIGANDLWIAAQALQDGSVLVTDNVRGFGRVPDLRVENWLRPQAAGSG